MAEIIELAVPAAESSVARFAERHSPTVRTEAVYVMFTSIDDTLAAIRVAGPLARAMGVPLTVIHFHAVPYPLSVHAPVELSPVETDAFKERLRAEGFDVGVRVYVCRSERQAIPLGFKRHSLVVLAGHRGWWPTPARRLRRTLEAAGHFVVFVDTHA